MKTNNLRLEQLKYFIAAMEHESFEEASEAIFVSRTSISKGVSDLEDALQIKLFESSGRGVKPTRHAHIITAKAKEILQSCEDMKSYARSSLSGRTVCGDIAGSLSVAVASSPYEGEAIPKEYFKGFREKYPKVALSLDYGSGGSCLLSFLEGTCDTLVTLGRYEGDGLLCTKLFDIPLHAVVSKDHPLTRKQTVSLSEISEFRVAKPYDLGLSHSIVDSYFKEKRLSPIYEKAMVFMDEYDRFIHNQLGIGLVIRSSNMEALYPDVRFLPLDQDDTIKIPVCLVSRKESELLLLLQEHLLTTHARETEGR